MSRAEIIYGAVAALLAVVFVWFLVNMVTKSESSYWENCRVHNEHRATLMGRSFQMNGKTYTGVQHSQWNDDIRCVSTDGSEQWVSLVVIENLLKAQAEVKP